MLRTNILFSGLLKIVGLGISFLLVPLTLGYLNDIQYGIWLVISSVLYWVEVFDIGLGNGMRNYLSAAISLKEWDKARIYLSTTLRILSILALALSIISTLIVYNVNLQRFFNTTAIPLTELRRSLLTALIFTLIMFVVKNIGIVLISMQKYALSDMIKVLGNALSLMAIYILTRIGDGQLYPVVFAFSAIPVLMFFLTMIPLFHHYPNLRPRWKDFNPQVANEIFGKGMNFFLIQVTSCLVIYGGANFFVTQYCGPAQVTVFNIAYKYFNLLVIGFLIFVSPLWSAYTDALVKNDFVWIRQTLKRSLFLWILTTLGGGFLLLVSNIFYTLWVGNYVNIPLSVSISVWFYISMFNLNTCLTMLINGMNRLRIQTITSIVGTAIYLIAVHLLGSKLGIEGIVCAMAFVYGGMAIIHLRQCLLLSHQRAYGIWNK